MANFNGPLTVTDTGTGTEPLNASGNLVSGNSETVTAKSGVATFQVQALTVPGASDTIAVTDPMQTTVTGFTVISTVAQVVTAVKVITPSAYVTANQSTPATVEAEVVDQDGQPMLYGSYPITLPCRVRRRCKMRRTVLTRPPLAEMAQQHNRTTATTKSVVGTSVRLRLRHRLVT